MNQTVAMEHKLTANILLLYISAPPINPTITNQQLVMFQNFVFSVSGVLSGVTPEVILIRGRGPDGLVRTHQLCGAREPSAGTKELLHDNNGG